MNSVPLPKVTMVMMTYNQQDIVQGSIQSLLDQQCEPIEILISDDASTDRTWEAIEESITAYSGHHSVKLNRNHENLGLMPHYNRCFELASGDIIIVCGGDDISHPDRASKIIAAFKETNALLVCSRVDLDKLNPDVPVSKRKSKQVFFATVEPEVVSTSFNLYIGATGAFHRDLLTKYGKLPEDDCYEDLILGFRASIERSIHVIDEALVDYRLGGISTAHQVKKLTPQDRLNLHINTAKKHIVVMEQRLQDCKTFGLTDQDPLVRAIRKQTNLVKLKKDLFEQGFSIKFVAKNIRQIKSLTKLIKPYIKLQRKIRKSQLSAA